MSSRRTILKGATLVGTASLLKSQQSPPTRTQVGFNIAMTGKHMTKPTIDLHINPAEETIRLGPLAVRFLVTGEDSHGSVAAFEVTVPGAQRLAAPAHSHDHYEETIYGIAGVLTWTIDGKQIEVGPGQALCIPRGAIHR